MNAPRAILYGAIFVGMSYVFSPLDVEAHELSALQVCEAEDDFGPYTFPVAHDDILALACADAEGTMKMVPGMEADELVRWMLDIGFYNPYSLLEQMWMLDALESPAPEE